MRDPVLLKQEQTSQKLVKDALREHVQGLSLYDEQDPFYVCDIDHVTQQYRKWRSYMPHVRPHYAVKCNPDVAVIRHLAALGAGFDCASKAELDLVLHEDVDPSRIILAHTCKTTACLRYARDYGVTQMTFDNAAELYKIAGVSPSAELYLRILADDPTAVCRLSEKFGASPDESLELLDLARSLELNIVGISFHVGSGASDPTAFDTAIREARSIWSGATDMGFNMHTLDIGGGFTQATYSSMAPVINRSLDEHFSGVSNRIIAEPGRYFAEGAYTLACNVVAKREAPGIDVAGNRQLAKVYLNDGVYGDFSCVIYEKAIYEPRILRHTGDFFPEESPLFGVPRQRCTIFGPTCDSMDCIRKDCELACPVGVGDWLYFPDMGAYSTACASTFNGFRSARDIVYISSMSLHA